jgi:hypothetical protein
MTVLSLWNWLKPLPRPAAVGRRRQRRDDRTLRARVVPRLEALEDRTLPSTYTVLNLRDRARPSLGSWPTKSPARHSRPPPWCMRPTGDWWMGAGAALGQSETLLRRPTGVSTCGYAERKEIARRKR